MRVLFIALLLALPIDLPATTLIVDGPGDGDANGTDDFDTIREALIDLGALGLGTDRASDEIHIVVDALTESHGWAINGSPASVEIISGPSSGEMLGPIHDSLTIEGDADDNGQPCVVNSGTPNNVFADRELVSIRLASDQAVTLHNLTLILSYGAFGDTSYIVIDEGDPLVPLLGASLTLERVIVTASTPGNIPLPPGNNGSWGTRLTVLEHANAILHALGNPASSDVAYTVRDCDFAHQQCMGLWFEMDSGSLEMTNTRILRNGIEVYWGILGTGLHVVSQRDLAIELDHVQSDRNLGFGAWLEIPGTRLAEMELGIHPGCSFSCNGQDGLGIVSRDGRAIVQIQGTNEEPIVCSSNMGFGFSAGLTHGSQLSIDHMVSEENGESGAHLSSSRSLPTQGGIRNSLFAFNTVIPGISASGAKPSNLMVTNIATGTASFEFHSCTFHEVVATEPEGELNAVPREIDMGFSIGGDIQLTLTDCILSGALDEEGFNLSGGSDKVVSLDHCVIALEGPDALSAVNSTGAGTINMIDCLFVDPMYVQTDDPDAPGYFDVQNPVLRAAASDGGPLSGWGNYVGPTGEEQALTLY